MEHTAFCAEEYDEKIRQTLPFYEEFYEQVIDVLDISGKMLTVAKRAENAGEAFSALFRGVFFSFGRKLFAKVIDNVIGFFV